MAEGKLLGLIAGLVLGALIGGTIVYTILTLQAIQQAQKLIHTSSVLFERDDKGRTSAIHYVRGDKSA